MQILCSKRLDEVGDLMEKYNGNIRYLSLNTGELEQIPNTSLKIKVFNTKHSQTCYGFVLYEGKFEYYTTSLLIHYQTASLFFHFLVIVATTKIFMT